MQLALQQLIEMLTKKQLTIATAESCTGGSLSSLLTSQSGASAYFDRGFVTYSDQAKIDMLGVDSAVLERFGAVSEQTAEQMAQGIIAHAKTDIAVAITGIAGPTGGSKDKPIGMVCFGFCVLGRCFIHTQQFSGNREAVVISSVNFVIQALVNELST